MFSLLTHSEAGISRNYNHSAVHAFRACTCCLLRQSEMPPLSRTIFKSRGVNPLPLLCTTLPVSTLCALLLGFLSFYYSISNEYPCAASTGMLVPLDNGCIVTLRFLGAIAVCGGSQSLSTSLQDIDLTCIFIADLSHWLLNTGVKPWTLKISTQTVL